MPLRSSGSEPTDVVKPASEEVRRACVEYRRALDLIAEIGQHASQLAANVAAFGPHIEHEAVSSRLGKLTEILRQVDQELTDAHVQLETLREVYVRTQLEALGLAPTCSGLRLNLGASARNIPGWINAGFYPAELSINLDWPLPFDDGACDYVNLSLVLEHLYYKKQAFSVLREVARVVRPGGVVRIIVPDLGKQLRAYAAADRRFFAEQNRFWPWTQAIDTPMESIAGWFGLMGKKPDYLGHKMGYDFETLRALLAAVGFHDIYESSYMGSTYSELRIDDLSGEARHECDGANYNLFVEAIRPVELHPALEPTF